ncbi:MAG TPA: hypothetical protein VFU02_20210, partial [Polyangiaceae bacterium]|nr:hypothetical protein [Polyangiaceae bacterium]
MNWLPRELSFRSGGVEVYACDAERQVWRVPPGSEPAQAVLLELGASGVGGFQTSGIDADGHWLGRQLGGESLAAFWSRTEPEWRVALGLGAALARALAACEERELWPGALHPAAITVDAVQLTVQIRAEALVAQQLGIDAPSASSGSTATRWTSPEQTAGGPWDAATNRYVLGLIVYRMLALEHPMQGQGLRLGFEQLATRGPAPFPEHRARLLPPGLQGFCLGLLDPDPARRPSSARAIALRFAAFAAGGGAEASGSGTVLPLAPAPAAAPPVVAKPARRSAVDLPAAAPIARRPSRSRARLRLDARWATVLAWAAPVAGGVLTLWALANAEPPRAQPGAAPPRAPLTRQPLGSGACESCHPRQTAEWRRSVMAHSVKSPMFLALEALIEEQAGRSASCAHGAGIMRETERGRECR